MLSVPTKIIAALLCMTLLAPQQTSALLFGDQFSEILGKACSLPAPPKNLMNTAFFSIAQLTTTVNLETQTDDLCCFVDFPDNFGEVISRLVPNELYDGSYSPRILDLLSGWLVSPDDFSFGNFGWDSNPFSIQDENDFSFDFQTGDIFSGDFVSPVARQFASRFDDTLDRVTGLFDVEKASISDFFRSPEDKLKEAFAFTTSCSGPGIADGEKVPDACVGPTYSFVIDGGVCIVDDATQEVVCSQPSVSIAKVPASCNLKYDKSTTVLGRSCVDTREFGETITKTFGKDPRQIDISSGPPFNFLDLEDVPFDVSVFFTDIFEDLA